MGHFGEPRALAPPASALRVTVTRVEGTHWHSHPGGTVGSSLSKHSPRTWTGQRPPRPAWPSKPHADPLATFPRLILRTPPKSCHYCRVLWKRRSHALLVQQTGSRGGYRLRER